MVQVVVVVASAADVPNLTAVTITPVPRTEKRPSRITDPPRGRLGRNSNILALGRTLRACFLASNCHGVILSCFAPSNYPLWRDSPLPAGRLQRKLLRPLR